MRIPTKQEWVEALRSGKYKQGREYLNDNSRNEYCCLGVLCELAQLAKLVVHDDGSLITESIYYDNDNSKSATDLPFGFRNEFGLTREQQQALIYLNDEENRPFEEIADYIEKNIDLTKPESNGKL